MQDRPVQGYHERESHPLAALFLFVAGIALLVVFFAALIVSWHQFTQEAPTILKVLLITAALVVCGTLISAGLYMGYLAWLTIQQKREHLAFEKDERRRANERHAVEVYLAKTRIPADERGNRAAIIHPVTHEVIVPASGNFVQSVPSHYAPHITYAQSARETAQGQLDQAAASFSLASLHIPTFGELLDQGEIGPWQRDILFCYEILIDEVSKHITGISPIRGAIGTQHTQLIVAGSQSGKTTYMSSNMAQAAAVGTVFYLIDPHLAHPEKSIAARMAAYADRFIMPPAATHADIKRLLQHAMAVRDARIQGKPTPFDGSHIMVVIDEVPALMAYQRSQDKAIRQLYLELALLMQSLGSQTAKFGMTGLFASQFATKEALGEIDFRDACMSQLIMRLHPTQAQAMRILGTEAVREIPKFPKGHGYLLLADAGDTRRVASGDVAIADLSRLAAQLPPSPLKPLRAHPVSPTPTRKIIPLNREVVSDQESGSQADRNPMGKPIDDPQQADVAEKVAQVMPMLGQPMGAIIFQVWGVRPGKGEDYQQARREYEQVCAIIRSLAEQAGA